MSIHQLPARISTIKERLPTFSGWQQEAVRGYIHLRDGVDYVNTNNRYHHAYHHLLKAYTAAKREHPQDVISLSRLCLWIGISLNENEDIPKIGRNKDAIRYYKEGLQWIRYVVDPMTMPIRMSLHNSFGVAIHHLNIGRGDVHIPKDAFYHYRTARSLFHRRPEDPFMKKIMKKVETNTGYIVRRGGDSSQEHLLRPTTLCPRNDAC